MIYNRRHGERMSAELLSHAVLRHKELAIALARSFPEADEETLADTLEGVSNLPGLLSTLIRSRMQDEVFAECLRRRIDEMRQRLERIEVRAGQKKALVLAAMEEAGIKKLVEADFTLSLRLGTPKLVVVDETLIPEEFWRPQAPRLDRQWLLAALKNGRSVPGAELGNPEPTLALRRS
jgi:hypothetical protein